MPRYASKVTVVHYHVIPEIVSSTQLQSLINPDVGRQAHDRYSAPILEESARYVSSLKKKKSCSR